MRVLITGSRGYIGRNLVKYLTVNDLAEVIEYDLENGRDIFNDWQLNFFVRQADLVIHLAGGANIPVAFQVPFDTYRINTEGSARVFHAAAKWKVQVIFASTWAVDLLNSPYVASKAGAEAALKVEQSVNGLQAVTLRFCNLYGGDQPRGYLIPNFIQNAVSGKPLFIYGNGGQAKDYIHVSDLVKGIWAGKDLPLGSITDVGTGTMTSVKEVADLIKELALPRKVKFEYIKNDERVNEENIRKPDITRLFDTGWKPAIDLRTGLKFMIEAYEKSL